MALRTSLYTRHAFTPFCLKLVAKINLKNNLNMKSVLHKQKDQLQTDYEK